jgi:hypothetical protein
LLVAIAARLLCWSLLTAALIRLTRTLGIEWYALAISLFAWITSQQNLGAGEWIFGGAEAKCFAYALIFLAIDAALKRRLVRSGLCCALAILCHLLVGSWATLALGSALLPQWRTYGRRKLATFLALVALAWLPVGIVASSYHSGGTPDEHRIVQKLAVLLSDPYHLDPTYFHGFREALILVPMTIATIWMLFRITSRQRAILLSSMLAVLALQFLAGLVAWKLACYWFLNAFPFRVPDVLILLFFLIALPCFTFRTASDAFRRHTQANPPFRGAQAARIFALPCLLILLMPAIAFRNVSKVLARDLPRFFALWQRFPMEQATPWQEMARWIRANTPADATFLTPPWDPRFWLDAERAQVVNYKRAPHSILLLEWQRRLIAVNGGPLQSRGYEVPEELARSYPHLTTEQIMTLHDSYGADYYLATEEHPGLKANLVHANGSYFLYRLGQVR